MFRIERDGARGARLLTERVFRAGQHILHIGDAAISARPSTYTVQVGLGVDGGGNALGDLAFLNHACDPTTVFDTEARVLIALRDLAPGDELTFFYPSTEWEMNHPFVCRCGAPQCIRLVSGAKYLPADTLGRYFINPHIRALVLAAVAAPLPFPTPAVSPR